MPTEDDIYIEQNIRALMRYHMDGNPKTIKENLAISMPLCLRNLQEVAFTQLNLLYDMF